MDSTCQYILRRMGELRNERSTWITHWRELSDYILPRGSRFFTTDRDRGTNRNGRIINNTATMSVRILSSGMLSGLTSPARPWFQLRTMDSGLNDYKPVKLWLEAVRNRMADVFLKSNLYTTLPQVYTDLGVYGTHAFAVMPDDDTIIRCQPFPVGSYTLANNHKGQLDTCYREFMMTKRQLVEKFGLEKCSTDIQSSWKTRSGLEAWVDVIHAIEPNPEWDDSKPSSKYKRFRSVYMEKARTCNCKSGEQCDCCLSEMGFDEFPIMGARWLVVGEDIYGQSPGMDALGDCKALQLLERRKAQAIDKLINPPMVAPSSLKNQRASLLPGDVTYVDAVQGQGFVPAYQINPHLEAVLQDIQINENRIKKAFFEDLFLMIANDDRSGITATEIQERHEEKMLMLGPVLERLNDELLDPLIDRTFSLMLKAGAIPPPPKEVQGMPLAIEYTSILAQAQKLVGVGALEKLMSFTGNVAQARPEVLDVLDFDSAVTNYADMVGVPPQIVNDASQIAAVRQQRAQQQQQQQALATAQQASQTAQTLGQTPVTSDTALGQMLNRMGGGAA